MHASGQGWCLPEVIISPVLSAKKLLTLQRSYSCYSSKLRRLFRLNLTSWSQLGNKIKAASYYKTRGLWADHSLGADGPQLFIPLFCAVDFQKVQIRSNQCCHLP